MQKHEQVKKHNNMMGNQDQLCYINEDLSFNPGRAKPVPNFAKQHDVFTRMLDKVKSNKKTTVPKPFGFEESKRTPKIDYMELENDMIRKERE